LSRRTALLLGIALAAAATYLGGLWLQEAGLQVAAKPIPVLCLTLWIGAADRYARAVRAGLVASLVGDVLLEAPRFLLAFFVAGLSAFLVAHLCYTAAFLARSRQLRAGRAVPFAAFVLVMLAVLGPGMGALAAPVSAYVAAISVMMWRAAAAVGAGSGASGWAGLAGALLFGASDTLIGLDRFRAPIPGVRYPIILLYWAGQLGIALSAQGRDVLRSTGGATLDGREGDAREGDGREGL